MRISSLMMLIAALGVAAPAAAQNPTVRGAVRDVAVPRLDQAQQQQQQRQQATDTARPVEAPPVQPPPPPQVVEPAPPPDTTTLLPTATVIRAGEPVLVFEREVFSYPGRARRDPFRPLTGDEGPLFEDLRINVILYSPNPGESVVLLSDNTNRVYRVRRGETVGQCCTVVDIGPTRIVFSVVDFGIRRQEVLALKSQREGA